MYAQLSSRARCQNFGQSLSLPHYFLWEQQRLRQAVKTIWFDRLEQAYLFTYAI